MQSTWKLPRIAVCVSLDGAGCWWLTWSSPLTQPLAPAAGHAPQNNGSFNVLQEPSQKKVTDLGILDLSLRHEGDGSVECYKNPSVFGSGICHIGLWVMGGERVWADRAAKWVSWSATIPALRAAKDLKA